MQLGVVHPRLGQQRGFDAGTLRAGFRLLGFLLFLFLGNGHGILRLQPDDFINQILCIQSGGAGNAQFLGNIDEFNVRLGL